VGAGPSGSEGLVHGEITGGEGETGAHQFIEDIATEVEERGDVKLSGGGVGSSRVAGHGERTNHRGRSLGDEALRSEEAGSAYGGRGSLAERGSVGGESGTEKSSRGGRSRGGVCGNERAGAVYSEE